MSAPYKSSDWKLFVYVPESGSFVLDYSQLNGSDVLGTTTGSMQEFTDGQIAEIVIHDGSTITQGIISDIQPQTAEVTLQIADFTTSMTKKFLVGNKIIIFGGNSNTVTNPTYGTTATPYFLGKIRSMSVDVQPDSDFATLNISASSMMEDLLNAQVSITKDTTTARATLINNAIINNLLSIGVSPLLTADIYHYASAVTETKTVGEWLQDLVDSSYMPIFDSTWCINTGLNAAPSVALYTIPNTVDTVNYFTLTDSEIAGLTFDWSGANSPTGVEFYLASNTAIVYQYGSNTVSGGNVFNYNLTADVKDLTELTSSGQKAMSMNKMFMPVSVTVPIAKHENQAVLYQPDDLSYAVGEMWPNLLHKPGKTVYIDSTKYGFTGLAIITGRTINVGYESFTVTYDLWKGFTA